MLIYILFSLYTVNTGNLDIGEGVLVRVCILLKGVFITIHIEL